MILMASSQQRFSRGAKQVSEKHAVRGLRKIQERTGRAENRKQLKNPALAYHNETPYHSLNIGTALMIDRIISMRRQAELRYCNDRHSFEICIDLLQENPEARPLSGHVLWFVIQVDPPPQPPPRFCS